MSRAPERLVADPRCEERSSCPERDVESSWRRSLDGLERLVRDAGLGSPRYVRFVREAYVLMMRDVLDAMAVRPDA